MPETKLQTFIGQTPVTQDAIVKLQQEINHIAALPRRQAAIEFTNRAKANIAEMRRLFIVLGPIFHEVRTRKLYLEHPEGFQSFKEWLSQPEIDIRHSLATDMINFWLYVVPQCEKKGIDVAEVAENVGHTKLRILVAPIREAQRDQDRLITQGMSREEAERLAPIPDVEELVLSARELNYEDLRAVTRPSGYGADDEPFEFTTTPAGNGLWHFKSREPLTKDQLEHIDRKLGSCHWYDERGYIRLINQE